LTDFDSYSSCAPIDFPLDHVEAHRQTLERLYERKATLDALIYSLEEYARCRADAPVTILPAHGN
jgi:hypothetical protein